MVRKWKDVNEINFSKIKNLIFVPKKNGAKMKFWWKKTKRNGIRYDRFLVINFLVEKFSNVTIKAQLTVKLSYVLKIFICGHNTYLYFIYIDKIIFFNYLYLKNTEVVLKKPMGHGAGLSLGPKCNNTKDTEWYGTEAKSNFKVLNHFRIAFNVEKSI